MAIVNTFPKCLDSPYLFEDPAAPERVPALMETAAGRIEAASNIQRTGQGDLADIGLFSYEAMFACLRALVYAKGYREAGLRCLLLACEHLYVRPGLLDVALIHAFERAQGLRLNPDEALGMAQRFEERTRSLLGAAGPTSS